MISRANRVKSLNKASPGWVTNPDPETETPMRTSRFLPLSSACCLILASCEKSKSPAAGAGAGETAEDLAAERVLIEEERIELERQRLADERAALEEEKEALLAERESRLAAREDEAEWQDLSIEERQRQLAEREAELGTREEDFALREASLSEQELELAGLDGLDDWEPEPLPELLEPVADYDTFYEDLQPYGSWYETPDYGYVYQPTVVVQDSSWRPYTRGRWACTNLGWNWISEEPFGWACFHYGRWALLDGRGWVWVPGDEWAPAWVCWREGSEHVGWAPLPPETLCYRGRGWDSSVEADFGIGALCFNFVARRHMADPLWRHCLPVARNPDCIRQTNNITNIRFHRDRIIAGGPAYERLRGEVGKPWPVYQIETDRFRAIRDLNQRNASVRGNRLAVFAPNLNTRWNDQLKPSRVAGRWDEVKVVRAESGIKPLWTERFREARAKRKETAAAPVEMAAKVKQFEVNRQKVGEAQRKLDEQQRQLSEARREKQVLRRAVAREVERPAAGDRATPPDRSGQAAADDKKERTVERAPTLAERQREAAERLRETRARRTGSAGIAPVPATDRDSPPTRMTRPGGESRPVDGPPESTGPGRGAVAGVREEADPRQAMPGGDRRPGAPAVGEAPGVTRVPRQEVTGDAATADNARRARVEELRRQQQEQAAQNRGQSRPDTERNPRSPQMEQPRREVPAQPGLRQEQAATEGEENTRRGKMEEARQQQLQAARERLEQARLQQAERQESDNAARLREAGEARVRQEQSRRAAEDNSRGQQQAEMRQQQEQAARQQQEEMGRQQQQEQARQEQARQQQEEMRRQQQIESARQQQEEARRQQQQEQARQQQEEMRRQQQEQARQEQQERMREQQEEARRQSEERARQQQEERARQQEQARQQQEERARQQEQARQQQEERARQQQEEQQRRQEERAREQSEQQEQQRQRGR
jgi:hypothetical protein